jgi:hypothetical protein
VAPAAPAVKRRTRSTLLLAGVVALLGAAVGVQLARERAAADDPLLRIDASAIRRIEVACRGCATQRFKHVDGAWWMRAPLQGRASEEAIARLLAIPASPVRTRHPRSALDPRKLGLEPPQATLRLDDTLLAFGATDALRGDRYVAVGDTIALVPDRFSAWLFAAPESALADRAGLASKAKAFDTEHTGHTEEAGPEE